MSDKFLTIHNVHPFINIENLKTYGLILNSHKDLFKSIKDLEIDKKINLYNEKKIENEHSHKVHINDILKNCDSTIRNIIKKHAKNKKLNKFETIDVIEIDYVNKNTIVISGITIEFIKETKNYFGAIPCTRYITKYLYTSNEFSYSNQS
jgi:hypothetical protein